MGIGEKTYEFCEKIEQDLKERFCEIDKVAEQNQMKVLGAMQKNHVSEACFAATTGYAAANPMNWVPSRCSPPP